MNVALKELGEISTGNTPSKKISEYYNSDDIYFVKPDIISDKGISIISKSNEYISENARAKARIVEANSIFVTCIGTIGKIGITSDGEYAFNQQINAIKTNDKIIPKYLAYNLLFSKPKLIDIANAPVVPIINKTQFGDFIVHIEPNIDIQLKIVSILDKLQSIIIHCQTQLTKLDELVKARFVEMFGDPIDNPMGWKKMQLQEIVTDDCSISYGIVQTGDEQMEGIPVFRPVDIVNRKPIRAELKKTTQEISDKYKRTILKGREMLITVRANIADTCIVDEEFKGCNVGRGIVPIRTDEKIMILEFLKYQIDNKHLNDLIKSKAKGITLIQLNMEDLRILDLIVPPISIQQQYTAFAEKINKSKAVIQKSLDKSQMLFDSLMQEYFGG